MSKKRIENDALPRACHGFGPLSDSASDTERMVWPPARTASLPAMSTVNDSGDSVTSASNERKPATVNLPDFTARSIRAPSCTVFEVSAR